MRCVQYKWTQTSSNYTSRLVPRGNALYQHLLLHGDVDGQQDMACHPVSLPSRASRAGIYLASLTVPANSIHLKYVRCRRKYSTQLT